MTNQIEFSKSGEWVMRITADRHIEVNESVTVTEAAQTVLEAVQKLLEQPEQEPVAWMCSNQSLVHKGYSRFSSTSSDDWNIPVYTKPQENIICERCEELAADKATWYRMAEMFANRLEELKKKGA